jgi:hypothetical protein
MTDRELVKAAKAVRLHLPGFRGTGWERNLPNIRPQLVKALLRPRYTERLRHQLNNWVLRDSGLKELREMTEEELTSRLLNGAEPERVLMTLLSSPNQEQVEMAARLFANLQHCGIWGNNSAGQQREATLMQQQQAEIARLRQLLLETTDSLEELRQRSELEQQLWEMERQSLLSRLADRETRMQQREQELLALRNQTALPTATHRHAKEEDQQQPRLRVTMVGNVSSSLDELSRYYEVETISPTEIPSEQVMASISTADEIWLLTYATPLPVKRRLLREANARVRCFSTYEDLMAFAEKGNASR